ncbi:MAG TPA: HAMP domain-containing sensor histidine kinase [Terracidiphilus sp.]|nr:HAMP domain-containing sensor histidine kinase [Terracidiphilus sp.]
MIRETAIHSTPQGLAAPIAEQRSVASSLDEQNTNEMRDRQKQLAKPESAKEPAQFVLWISGVWVIPFLTVLWTLTPGAALRGALITSALLLAPAPALLYMLKRSRELKADAAKSKETAEQLKLQLDTVRYRTARLREELQAADKQARLSHQLTLLGQFTAGFMHEFNNPLAIVAGRLEVLLEERKQDAALCADLEQMLKEARYMSKIAGTLLRALRRERSGEVFQASDPQTAMEDAIAAFRPRADDQGVNVFEEINQSPRVDVPGHVVTEVIRGLISNALEALKGRENPTIWARIEPYRTAGARVLARIEDNGPGVPEEMSQHLFEPFASQSSGRERLGLGLFLAASLLDMYDGRIRYEMRYGGGSSFVVELPPARFTRGQPYHWFAAGATE